MPSNKTAAAFETSPKDLAVGALRAARRWLRWIPVALLAAAAPAVHAEAGNPLEDRVSLSLGGFLLDTSTKVRVDGDVRGTEIDTDKDLGLNDSDRFRLDGYWRMTPRQKLRVMYFETNNEATKTLDRTLIFNDTVYPVNLDVHATTKTQVTEVAYEFAFMRRDTYELSGSFGIHNLKFETGLSGELNGTPLPSLTNTSQANGPLPVLGVHGVWRMNDKFYLDAMIQYFSIGYDVYDGRVTDYTASVVWQFAKHFGVGAGWNRFVTSVDVDGDRFDGMLRWTYGGARIFLNASF
jgi:hypothetical protein